MSKKAKQPTIMDLMQSVSLDESGYILVKDKEVSKEEVSTPFLLKHL